MLSSSNVPDSYPKEKKRKEAKQSEGVGAVVTYMFSLLEGTTSSQLKKTKSKKQTGKKIKKKKTKDPRKKSNDKN